MEEGISYPKVVNDDTTSSVLNVVGLTDFESWVSCFQLRSCTVQQDYAVRMLLTEDGYKIHHALLHYIMIYALLFKYVEV